jgi:hypothetical protein
MEAGNALNMPAAPVSMVAFLINSLLESMVVFKKKKGLYDSTSFCANVLSF